MKKIAALFASALSFLMTVCLTIGTSAAESADAPLLDGFMKDYGHYLLLIILGVFLIVAIAALVGLFKSSRKKHMRMKEYRQTVFDVRDGKQSGKDSSTEKTTEKTVERIIEKNGNGEVVERVVEKPVATSVQPGNYYYYDYRYYNNNAYPEGYPYCGPACRELEYEARRVPERHLNEIPPVRRAVKPNKPITPQPVKPTKPVLPTRPVEVKDVSANQDGVVTVQDDCNKVNKKHIVAAVALTAVGCHLLHKISK